MGHFVQKRFYGLNRFLILCLIWYTSQSYKLKNVFKCYLWFPCNWEVQNFIFTWSLIGNNSCHFDTKATPLQPLKSVISTRHFNTRPTLFKPPKILIKTVTFTRHFDKNPSLRQKTQRSLKAPKILELPSELCIYTVESREI